jgi:SPP1 family predicted phage head-tail adaptor
MRVGELRERLAFYTFTTTPNGMGGSTKTPLLVFITTGKVIPVNGSRQLIANQQVLEDGVIIKIRRRTDHSISTKNSILWRGELYEIQSIIDIKARQWEWEIICKKAGHGFVGLLGTPVPQSIIETPHDTNIQVP